MLQLQRASAGSGKTYLLAKKFIEYFISKKEEDGSRRLLSTRELRESLQHILAITFTNKATNEMKLRIVEKLDALACWTPATPISKVDYLSDFAKDFNTSPERIAELCRHALKILLTDYGDFKVSTIDSFFQTVLRTFAYEADLDDTYQLELDSNYVTQMGLDTTLDEIETTDTSSQGQIWVDNMMQQRVESGKGWNIFQKKDDSRSIYGQVLNASRNLTKEDFKEIREELDAYFQEHPDFFTTFHQLCRVYERDLREAFYKMRRLAMQVRDAFADAGLDINATAGQYLATRVRKMAETWNWDHSDDKDTSYKIPQFTRKGSSTRVFNPKVDNPHLGTAVEDHIEQLATEMFEAFDLWRTEAKSEKMRRWRVYSATMPYVGLLQSVRDNSRLFLTDSNTVELGETNSILHRIIGDDDAPFVYERLGSRLEHFLIDEFQDTSRLQWINLRPLIAESEGKGYDNLIIGDAKQSIYRFRNADPSLISHRVPTEFASSCRTCGNTPAENTNWRSSRRIVEFNNMFFRFFSRELSEDMERLYSNTVQPPHHKEDYGFVKLQLFKKSSDEDIPAHFNDIPLLISDMLERGYEMNDIAVLVDTRAQGEMIIESLLAYNRSEDIARPIDFISADSLKVGESPAVQLVISTLEAINNGTRAELRPEEDRRRKGAGDWSRLKADFTYFAMRNKDLPLSEVLSRFLHGEYNPDSIRDMLAEMSTTVLPALVENIIQLFIPDAMRRMEAPFLAALQDSVLDFSEGHSADIASFLLWWEKKGRNTSVSSPEDADAVQIMTVHKSKGLEFRCVIVPYSKQTVRPLARNEREWLWVRPDLKEAEGVPHIPHIPVWSDPVLAETPHSAVYEEYLTKYRTDKVNMAYVAYTRAVDELYIYTPCDSIEDAPFKNEDRIGSFLWRCATEAGEILSDLGSEYPEASCYMPRAEEFETDEENLIWTLGVLPSREEVMARTSAKKKKETSAQSGPVTDYRKGIRIPALCYQDPASPEQSLLSEETAGDEDTSGSAAGTPEETEDSRIFGEVMHSVMERIVTADDIPAAILKMKAGGHFGHRQAKELTDMISEVLRSVEGYGWFAPGIRVLNERGMVISGKLARPDRIIIHPDGRGVIVDYKFGEHRNDAAYSRQVRRYAKALSSTGLVKKCEAYIWYVSLGKVLKVDIG